MTKLRLICLRIAAVALLLVVLNDYMFYRSRWKSDVIQLVAHFSKFAFSQQPFLETCVIPLVEPDPSWIQGAPPISCAYSGLKVAKVVEGGFVEVKTPADTICSFKNVVFTDDFSTKTEDDPLPVPAERSGRFPCPSDVFYVYCYENLTLTYEQLFRCVSKKPQVYDRVRSPAPALTSLDVPFEERLNILMFGLDSVSRVGWLEQMKTFVCLSIGVTFEGYNIVGDGTTAAILALTTGYFEQELHESRRGFSGAQQIDDFDFIWKRLAKEAKYVTLWDEDGASQGTFHYRLLGFNSPPVDYYGRLFQLELEKNYPKDACLDNLTIFEEMARQFRHMFDVYPDPIRKFGLVFSSHYTHTSAGVGSQEAYRADSALLDEVKKLLRRGHLNNSALIFFSDHGSRYDNSRATMRGKITERLPILSIALPKWFRKKYPKQMAHLKEAARRLTTPFDLHATLLDLGGLSRKADVPRRGISFFQPIPARRTCEEAGILPHWCSCLTHNENAQDLSLTDPLVKKSLLAFEKLVNEQVLADVIASGYCAKIRANQPIAAQRLALRKEVAQFVKTIDGHGRKPEFYRHAKVEDNGVSYLLVSFRTEPGGGEFEVTFTHYATNNTIRAHRNQISRTNRYGSAPKCIQDKYPHLRRFCYCISALSEDELDHRKAYGNNSKVSMANLAKYRKQHRIPPENK